MNKIDCSSIENSTLAVLGRSIWNYITLKHLTSILDPFAVRVLGKILTSTQFVAYASIKLKFHEYLNTGVSN
jgi:endoribonuclease Dicer